MNRTRINLTQIHLSRKIIHYKDIIHRYIHTLYHLFVHVSRCHFNNPLVQTIFAKKNPTIQPQTRKRAISQHQPTSNTITYQENNIPQNESGQISIIPKPELKGFWGSSLIKPPFRVTSADVVIICPDE